MTEQRAPDESPLQNDGSKGNQRRRPAIIGSAIGVAVVAAMIAVLVSHDPGTETPTAAPTAAQAGAAPADPAAATAASAAAAAAGDQAAGDQAAAAAADPLGQKPVVTAGTGKLTKLVVTPIIEGAGPPVEKGQTVTVNYVLVGYADGKQIESSWDAGGPIAMPVGVGRLIKGWDIGLPGQRVGSRVRLDVPAGLAYGPSKGDLRFVVDILSIN
jgi:peptidylprolyl isomerase